MKGPFIYHYITLHKLIGIYLAIIIVPVFMPYLFNFIMASVSVKINQLKSREFTLPLLPQPNKIAYYDENTIYFSYAPDSTQAKRIINELIKINNLNNIQTMGFQTKEDAEQYISVKSIVPNATSHFQNTSYYSNVICNNLHQIFNYSKDNCSVDLSGSYKEILSKQYNIDQYLFDTDITNNLRYKNNIFLHINFNISEEEIGGIPMHIQYEVVHNQTMLDETMRKYPDLLGKTYSYIRYAPFWTGYSYTLQEQLDNITINMYTDLNIQKTYYNPDQMSMFDIQAILFYEMTCLLGFALIYIFQIIIFSQQCGQNYVLLKRLGINTLQNLFIQFMFIFIPALISGEICAVTWHYTGILPYNNVTLGFAMFSNFLITLLISISSQFFVILAGQNQVLIIVLGCIIAFFIFMVGGLFHMGIFQGNSIFDPSLAPQPVIWILMCIVPPLGVLALMDMMTTTIPLSLHVVMRGAYVTKVEHNLTQLQYVFNRNDNAYNQLKPCFVSNAKYGIMKMERCYYYLPPMYNVVIMTLVQSLIVLPILILWLSYVVSHRGFRRFPTFFFLQKEFWHKFKNLKPGKPIIDLENITVGYKVSLKYKKKYVLGRNIALKQISYAQDPYTISGVIGECSSGKTTLMNYLAGELSNFNVMKSFNSKNAHPGLHMHFDRDGYDLSASSKKNLVEYLQNIYEKPRAIVMENFDLTNPIDAHLIKPYIGYLAQDFSNVWMNISCYWNVYISLILRKSAQGFKIKLKDCKQEVLNLLQKVGLSESAVVKRKASQLSGGMLRRLALANAIAGDPKLILLDELSSGVDPVVKYKIIQCIKEIVSKQDTSIIVSTHDTSEIQQLIQKLTILDDGFLMVKNTTTFDLQQRFDIYTIRFYSKQSTCNEIIGNNIKNIIQQQNIIENQEKIILNQVTPHGIEIQIESKLSEENVVQINQLCEQIGTQYEFDDYLLSKARLDSAYMKITNSSRKNDEYGKNATSSIKQQKYSNNRLLNLIKLFILAEYKNKLPIALIFTGSVILIGCLFKLQYSLITQLVDNSFHDFNTNIHYNVASTCLKECRMLYSNETKLDVMATKCFTDRLNKAQFDGRETVTDYYNYQSCAYYFNFLGLDQQYAYYSNIGDNQINNIRTGFAPFTIKNSAAELQKQRSPLQQMLYQFNDPDGPQVIHGGINPYYINYSELYSEQNKNKSERFDPSINKTQVNEIDKFGIAPYILPFSAIYRDDGCFMNDLGRSFCAKLVTNSKIQCGRDDNFNKTQCLSQFTTNKCNRTAQLLKQINSFNILDQTVDYMNFYQESVQQQQVNVDSDLRNYSAYFEAINNQGAVISPANFEFDVWNVKNERSVSQELPRLAGTIHIKQTNLLPNTGFDKINYAQNKVTFVYSTKDNYKCNNVYSDMQVTEDFIQPQILKAQIEEGIITISVPTAPPVILFNKANEPAVKLTSALLRKQMFNAVEDGNYTPWNSSYSLISRPMPKISNPDVNYAGKLNNSNISQAILIVMLPVSIIFVAIYISIRQAQENENNTIRLLRYHFVSPLMWYIANYCTNLLIGMMMTLLMLLIILIIQPNILTQTTYTLLNIPFYIISGLFCVSYGMFISFLIKKTRYTVIIQFIIALFIAFFNMFLLNNDAATYFIGFFLPSYTMQYYYYRTLNDKVIGIGMVFYGIMVAVLQTIGGYVVFNLSDIILSLKIWWKHGKQNEKYPDRDYSQQEEMSLLSHHTSYDLPDDESKTIILDVIKTAYTYYNGTKALKNINFQVERGLIFGLLGSNGSGKSTMMCLLAGVLKAQQGKAIVHIDGRPNVNLYKIAQTSKHFSVVPQHDLYWGNLTVYDHFKYITMINCLKQDTNIDLILQSLELSEFANEKVSNLSGGMKRKVSIGMTLTLQSPIIAFDEPSCGLGVVTKRQLHKSIRNVLNKNTTIIIISHDMDEIEQLTDKCCIMSKGEIIASGSISQLRKASPYGLCLHIRTIETNVELLNRRLVAIETEYNDKNDVYSIQYSQQVTESQILEKMKELNILGCQWNIEKQLMENIFIDLVKSRELQ